jgi:hypothetical protein
LPALALALVLAACQAATPSPSASPSPSAPPAPPSGDEVIASFLEIVGDPELTMHVVLHGSLDVAVADEAQTLALSMDMDLSADDAVGSTLVDTGPGEIRVEMLLVDDRAYVDDNGTWTEIPGYEQTSPLNPFGLLTRSADVAYDRQVELNGRSVHHLHALVWIGGDISSMEAQGWTDVVIDYDDSDIVVDDLGTPIRLDFRGGVSGRYGGQDASAAFDVTYEFTDVGEPVEIPTPPETPASVFPAPIPGQAVYDEAGVLSAEVEATLEERIDAIEERSGAQVVVYFQVDPTATETSNLEAAQTLMDEWGIGQAGLDDGFVILVSLDESLVHGKLATYAGAGLVDVLGEAAQQQLRDEVMLPAFAEGQYEIGTVEGLQFIDGAIP